MEAGEPARIWAEVCQDLSAQMSGREFQSWVARLVLMEVNGERVVLRAPNAFCRDWISENLLHEIEASWKRHDPQDRCVGLQVSAQVARPAVGADDGNVHALPISQIPATATGDPALRPQTVPMTQERFRFDNFVVGPSNEVPWAVAKQVARGEQYRFNPLFIHGGYGLGKTHLLRAIAALARGTSPGRRVLYLTAEEFVQRFVAAVRASGSQEFKADLRSTDLLLIDDMHFLAGKQATQDEFVHTLHTLVERGAQVVLSADRAPAKIAALDARLRSRLAGGLVCNIAPAAFELRREILRARIAELKSDFANLKVPEPVVDFMASRITSSPRELLGALNMVLSTSVLVGREIELPLVEDVLSDLLATNTVRVTIADIQKATAARFGLQLQDLLSRRKTRNIVRPRQIAMYLAKELTSASLPLIGQRFDGRDHTTVIHAVRTISDLMGKDASLANDVEGLRRALTKVKSPD